MTPPNGAGDAPPMVAVLLRGRRGGPKAPFRPLAMPERAALRAASGLAHDLGGQLAALTFGTASTQDAPLLLASRIGCHRVIRVDPGDLGNLDYLGVARALTPALKKLGADFVVCGDPSAHCGQGAVGPAVAELLGVPHLNGLIALQADSDRHVVATQRIASRRHRYRCRAPMVACMAALHEGQAPREDATEPPARKQPRSRADIEVMTLRDLDIDPSTLAGHLDIDSETVPDARGARIFGSPAELVAHLADRQLLSP